MATVSTGETNRRWAVILGVSSGSGAAIARAVARDPGMHIFGLHRGHHAEMASRLEGELLGLGVKVVMRVADAGTAEGAAAGAAAFHDVAGPRSAGLYVHSIAAASL